MDSSYSNQSVQFVMAKKCSHKSVPMNPQEITELIKINIIDLQEFADKNIDCLLCSLLTLKGLTYMNAVK